MDTYMIFAESTYFNELSETNRKITKLLWLQFLFFETLQQNLIHMKMDIRLLVESLYY